MRKRLAVIRAFTRSAIDYCMVPGAAIGAEILWLYSLQWKNRLSMLALAMISVIYSNMDVSGGERNNNSFNEPENTR